MHTSDKNKERYSPIDHFGTDLMDQIIEVEVDTAVRRLEADGIMVDETLSHTWYKALMESITHMFLEEKGHRRVLPGDFQEMLHTMLGNLIDADSDKMTSKKAKTHSKTRKLYAFLGRILS